MFISVFFYGAKPQTEAQRSEDGVARLHLTAVRLRGAIWRLTRLRRSTAEPKCRISEYNGSNLYKRLKEKRPCITDTGSLSK